MEEFVGEEIEVAFEKKPGPPTAFQWRARAYKIVRIEAMKRVLDFRRPWYRRRHRDHYVVETDQGEHFRIYFHRGPGRRYWVLYDMIK
jgi:hypothetical protein